MFNITISGGYYKTTFLSQSHFTERTNDVFILTLLAIILKYSLAKLYSSASAYDNVR